jgi:transcriptional regulator with XRE-family HTH domain
MSPEQVRAARGWLGWSQQTLAERAHVGLSTIKDFENGSRKPIANNLAAIQQALEAAGVELVFDPKGKPKGLHVNGRSR